MWIESEAYMPELCSSCHGSGVYDVGDCEDGVWETCPACQGTGEEEDGDEFIPNRDAWKIGD